MKITTNAQRKDRKNLVKAIAEITGQASKYNGAPVFPYTVGNLVIERDGSITTEDEAGMSSFPTLKRRSANKKAQHCSIDLRTILCF